MSWNKLGRVWVVALVVGLLGCQGELPGKNGDEDCFTDNDCPINESCNNGRCGSGGTTRCRTNADCPRGQQCNLRTGTCQ